MEIMEDCTAIQSRHHQPQEDIENLDPFSLENLHHVESATQEAGKMLNSTFHQIKEVHAELRNFIQNLDEKWVEKCLLEWTEQKLAAETKSICD